MGLGRFNFSCLKQKTMFILNSVKHKIKSDHYGKHLVSFEKSIRTIKSDITLPLSLLITDTTMTS